VRRRIASGFSLEIERGFGLSQMSLTTKKQVIAVWLFAFSYFLTISLVGYIANKSGSSQLPNTLSLEAGVSFAINLFVGFVPVVLFLVLFVRHFERRGSVASSIASLGMNRSGIKRSLLWAVPFLVLLIVVIEVWAFAAQAIFGPNFLTALSRTTNIPKWYAILTIISASFNAVMEEMLGRGYLLDRLMLSHPASMAAALPAVLGVSALGMLYHIGPYFFSYQFSPLSAFYNLVIVFLSFIFVGLAYVRSRVQNISGPILFHFLLDALPFVYVLLA
jgi:membrane protease YdiL (CAAX protease family)